MTRPPLSISWKDHHSNFILAFTSLLTTGALVDVTLVAGGKHIKAHKVVLSACSSYFKSLFISNPCKHPIVILKDVHYADLKLIVDFMYYGEVEVPDEQMLQFSKMAVMLGIKTCFTIGGADSVTSPSEDPSSSERMSEEQSSTEEYFGDITPDPIRVTLSSQALESSQHSLASPKIIYDQMSQQTSFARNTPNLPSDVELPVVVTNHPIFSSLSRQTSLGGMSSGRSHNDLSESHSPRKWRENNFNIIQPVHSEGSTPNEHQQQTLQQQMINRKIRETLTSESQCTQKKRIFPTDLRNLHLALEKMRQGGNSFVEVARMFNVNEDILRRRCKHLRIPTPPTDRKKF